MGLPWVRLDTNLPSHDKILDLLARWPRDAGRATGFSYACGFAYSGHNGTDGVIPFGALPLIHGTPKDPDRLVEVGLWVPDPKGWRMPNWLERQQSAAVGEAARKGNRLGALKANCVRWHGPECGCWRDEATA